jgi:hypothetical protein
MAMGVTGPEFEVCAKIEMWLACSDSNWLVGIWPGTGTIFGGSNKTNNDKNDNDRDLPIIEELLLTNLQAQGFTTGGRGPDKTSGVEEVAADERGVSADQSRSAQSNNSGGSPGKPCPLHPPL